MGISISWLIGKKDRFFEELQKTFERFVWSKYELAKQTFQRIKFVGHCSANLHNSRQREQPRLLNVIVQGAR